MSDVPDLGYELSGVEDALARHERRGAMCSCGKPWECTVLTRWREHGVAWQRELARLETVLHWPTEPLPRQQNLNTAVEPIEVGSWGLNSLRTGWVYRASSKQVAAYMCAATGVPDRFEVVRFSGGRWVAEPQVSLPPIPAFAQQPVRHWMGDDAEIIRLVRHRLAPMRDEPVEPPPLTAAQIRAQVEADPWYRLKTSLRRLVGLPVDEYRPPSRWQRWLRRWCFWRSKARRTYWTELDDNVQAEVAAAIQAADPPRAAEAEPLTVGAAELRRSAEQQRSGVNGGD